MYRKGLQNQTMKNNFLFAAVMLEPDNCRKVLSCVLDMEIEQVIVSREKSIVYHPEYHGVRLDVFAKGTNGTCFNVEMQIAKEDVRKRSRYYHDQMDMELLLGGRSYGELPDTYVIFICDYDPLGLGKYRYTLKNTLYEDSTYKYEDGRHTIFLSTQGKDESEVPKQLVNFLHFIGAPLQDSQKDYDDELVGQLQKTVAHIKQDREMGARYMLFEELLQKERSAGKAESILLLLSKQGEVPEELRAKVCEITEIGKLDKLLMVAAESDGLEAFTNAMQNL